jgi:hypothetical protein
MRALCLPGRESENSLRGGLQQGRILLMKLPAAQNLVAAGMARGLQERLVNVRAESNDFRLRRLLANSLDDVDELRRELCEVNNHQFAVGRQFRSDVSSFPDELQFDFRGGCSPAQAAGGHEVGRQE